MTEQVIQASFSKSWQNQLMWAHYADGFKGLCLEFEFDYSRINVDGPPFAQVQYWSDHPPNYTASDLFAQLHLSTKISEILDDKKASALADIAHEKMKLAVTSKSSAWSYEERYRMVKVDGIPYYYDVPNYKLSGIIFGTRIDGIKKSKVIRALGPDLRYSQLELVPNRYGFSRNQILPRNIRAIAEPQS
ncbi:MAG: DUF2971 domain-containing protein [Pelagimonas sp.]